MTRVLIIDDDISVSKLLQEHLTNEGYEVTIANRAEAGFEAALDTQPDLIMLDVNMPDATGFQLCARFRKNNSTQTTPIIMMTGAARYPNQQAIGLHMGANRYILKPFDVIQVGEQVHDLLGSKRPVQPAPVSVYVEPSTLVDMIIEEKDEEPATDPEPVPLETLPDIEIGTEKVEPPVFEEPVPMASEETVSVSGSVQSFYDFSVDAVILTSRLPKTRAGRHIADQLLRCGTSVGARMTESQSAETQEEGLRILRLALKDLREAGYWLMLIRKAELLETPSVQNLESKCHDLIATLSKSVSTLMEAFQINPPYFHH